MASPGVELLFNSVKNQINSPQDSILCLLHWQIVSAGYKCIGLSEKGGGQNDLPEETEMLPDGWNTTPDLYVLRYRSAANGATYVLKVIAVDGMLLVHFWRQEEDNVANMNVTISEHASQDYSSYKKALKNVADLVKQFKLEILDRMKPSSPKAGSSRKTTQPRRDVDDNDPLRIPQRHRPRPTPEWKTTQPRRDVDDNYPLRVPQRQRPRPTPEWADPDDPFSIGRGDLDPLGGGGAGMMFNPMRGGRGPRFGIDPNAGLPARLPPGAIPPGARFDPYGPPGTHPNPDPDHMPPPGYDDMFM